MMVHKKQGPDNLTLNRHKVRHAISMVASQSAKQVVMQLGGPSSQQGKVIPPYSPPSYALMYAVAVGLLGTKKVHYYVGMEPSGRYHNELCLDYNSRF